MGQALAKGLLKANWCMPQKLVFVDPSSEQQELLRQLFPQSLIVSAPLAKTEAVLAVKPHLITDVCSSMEVPRVLSIAAGISTQQIQAAIGSDVAVVRAMPNTPALVGAGISALCKGASASDDDLAWGESILASVGEVVQVEEAALDAVTGLSGSGPAYVFYFVEALVAAGQAQGLPPDIAKQLSYQTVVGAAALLAESGKDAQKLRAAVTTPNGTTAAGLASLMEKDFAAIVSSCVTAATQRSEELRAQSS